MTRPRQTKLPSHHWRSSQDTTDTTPWKSERSAAEEGVRCRRRQLAGPAALIPYETTGRRLGGGSYRSRRGRHPGPDPGQDHRRIEQELPSLSEHAGHDQRRYPAGRRGRPTHPRQPQRLRRLDRIEDQPLRRPRDRPDRRRLPRHGLLMPHRRQAGQERLPDWQEANNTAHRKYEPASSTTSPRCALRRSPLTPFV